MTLNVREPSDFRLRHAYLLRGGETPLPRIRTIAFASFKIGRIRDLRKYVGQGMLFFLK